ncbi:MAG: hypothetical protein RTU92_03385 [Candidatus Thorarchaeota archaeon]
MNSTNPDSKSGQQNMRKLVSNVRKMLKEPILEILIERSALTEAQIETLLIDLVLEDSYGASIAYESKASLRTKEGTRKMGVSRGAFNRTLSQARKNVTKSVYTLLLMAYLGLFDMAVFRPFEEIASRIGGYRMIREVLAGKTELTSEEMESYRSAERLIVSALEELDSPLVLKTDTSKRKAG